MAYKRPLTSRQSGIIAILWLVFAIIFLLKVQITLLMLIVLIASAVVVFYPMYKSRIERSHKPKRKAKGKKSKHRSHLVAYLAPLLGLVPYSTSAQSSRQETPSPLKLSGYLQIQSEWGEAEAIPRVGRNHAVSKAGQSSIGIRRGRIKLDYKHRLSGAVIQIDLTERGLKLKDAYIRLNAPWASLERSFVRLGIFDRPFGYAISYSSSRRETPERPSVFPLLFPEERDLGAMLCLQGSQGSTLDFLKLEAGFFAGNSIQPEVDRHRDFIAHLSAQERIGKSIDWGLGLSYYHGTVVNSLDNSLLRRRYYGIDAQIGIHSPIGLSQIRGEYLWGEQPSSPNSFRSPNSPTLAEGYSRLRHFAGAYISWVQQISTLPLKFVLQYDFLDRNTHFASGDPIGELTSADLATSTWGVGLVWEISKQLRLQTYYEMPNNEAVPQLKGYEQDKPDNNLTLRLQYQF